MITTNKTKTLKMKRTYCILIRQKSRRVHFGVNVREQGPHSWQMLEIKLKASNLALNLLERKCSSTMEIRSSAAIDRRLNRCQVVNNSSYASWIFVIVIIIIIPIAILIAEHGNAEIRVILMTWKQETKCDYFNSFETMTNLRWCLHKFHWSWCSSQWNFF